MSDRDQLEAMLKRAGIEYEVNDGAITVEGGYSCFYTIFTFKDDGSLQEIGAYE